MKAMVRQFSKLLFILFISLICLPIKAQQIKLVSGRVLAKAQLEEKEDKPFKDEAVYILAFNTVAEAQDAIKVMESQQDPTLMTDNWTLTDEQGYYEIRVAESGALIFKVGISTPVLEMVNYRMEINVKIDAGIQLGTVDIIGIAKDINPLPEPPEIIGNKLIMRNVFPIPSQFGKTNARLIIQPYLVECKKMDTISYPIPIIRDGEQYKLTQERLMGYDIKRDPLAQFVDTTLLTEDKTNIEWEDTITVPDPTKNYFGNAIFQLEDFNEIYYNETKKVLSCQAKRPLKFLEYSLDQYDLDPNKYVRKPKREIRDGSTNVSLTFLVGKAEIDPEDPNNEIQLNKLRDDLMEIITCEDCKLKEIHVTGVSSPEGSYASNLALSQRRAAFAKQQITSLLPATALKRVFMPAPDAQVASWSEVADLFERDSLLAEAEAIRKIVAASPKSPDAQFAKIRALPYYTTKIKDHLPELRYMRFEYKHEVFRELTPDEILDRYEHNADYRSGKKEFELYEFWHLFRMIKDPKELETLYRRAYEFSKKIEGQPWILAANNLAVSYLKRDTVDTTILEPFIDRKTKGSNIERTRLDGITKELINPEEVVANQLAMYLKANNFEQASVMAQILPETEKNAKLKAFTMCLGGYYKGGKTEEENKQAREIFELVKSSSPLNEVIMYLAMNSKRYDIMAQHAAKKLPTNDPKTWYLKAIIHKRAGADMTNQARYCLIKCLTLDESYKPIAEMDGDIGEDLYNDTLDMYDMEKDMIDAFIQQYNL